MKTSIKFCGLTEPASVEMVPEGGAAGFVVNVPASPRNLTIAQAARLAEEVPSTAEIWAVTSNPPAELIHKLFDEIGVDRIQVYGKVPGGLEFLETHHIVPSLAIPRVGVPGPDPKLPTPEEHPRLHLDAEGDPLPRGSPDLVNWEVCRRLVDSQPGRKLILAGGLVPENVAEALIAVRPSGVDVCSGVESAPGTKDLAKMSAFVEAVVGAEDSLP